jgi:histidine kinase
MILPIQNLQRSLFTKLTLLVGMTLLASMLIWAYFNINYHKNRITEDIMASTNRLTNTIRLGAHYAMMLNSRDDITQIISNIGKQKGIAHIRIYNKEGQIKFSNMPAEVNTITNIKAEACDICHRTDPPLVDLSLEQRTRFFHAPEGHRLLGIISPICNEPSCSTDACHVHPADKSILGALDVVISLEKTDLEIFRYQKGILWLSIFLFLMTSALIFLFMLRFVNRPIKKLIDGTRNIGAGNYDYPIEVNQTDEMGLLAKAIFDMGTEIARKQAELNRQRDEYQNLFELVPCLITIQDSSYRLIRYNGEFLERFQAKQGDYCYQAYMGKNVRCDNCPVERTFSDGKPHYGEESRKNDDGTITYWMARTSPMKNDSGDIVAVMEVCLDITRRKQLEDSLERSEKKYHAIFNNIPNPVFVLDVENLEILDCNESVETVYGYSSEEIIRKPFLDLFQESEKSQYESRLRSSTVLNKVQQTHKNGRTVFVDIWLSPSEYPGRKVLLVATSDITQRLEAEQQFIQASKMATLGEMATGVAHELNQPLSVIKTASSFLIKKASRQEPVADDIRINMLQKIDSNVDRATRIILHMRQFARKSEACLERININDILEKAFEIFSQQLKVRAIEVIWEIDRNLPLVMGDPGRLEQVFINLLLNARDAIEDRWNGKNIDHPDKRITLTTRLTHRHVRVDITDTGTGISKAVQEKIFEPFFTTKEVGKGTGLGLSISYGIIKECGGTITLQSEEGNGATFTILFPIQENANGTCHFAGG